MTYNMSVSNVSTATSVRPTTQVKESIPDKIKEKWDNMGTGGKVATATVSGLTVLGGIMLAVHAIKKGKIPTEAPKVPTGTTKPIQTPHIEVAHTPKAQSIEKAVEEGTQRAQAAAEKYNQGGNYGKISKETTKNLSKEGKKTARQILSELHSKQVAAEIQAQHQNSSNLVSTIDANKTVAKASQGMKSALPEEISARVDAAQTAAKQAQAAAEEVNKVAQNNPTGKNIRRATIAQNQAEKARIAAQNVEAKGNKRQQAISDEIKAKMENRAKMLSSEGYEAGLAKQEANAQKATGRKVTRDLKNIISKPKYQRTVKEFQRNGYTAEKLQSIINNPKSSDIEYLAAQEALQRMAK